MKKVTKIMAMLVALIMATGMTAFPAFAEDVVATIGSETYTSLSEALDAASASENAVTIQLAAGTFELGEIVLPELTDVTIKGAAEGTTLLNSSVKNSSSATQCKNVTFDSITFDNSYFYLLTGAGIDYDGITIKNCTFVNNSADINSGAAILARVCESNNAQYCIKNFSLLNNTFDSTGQATVVMYGLSGNVVIKNNNFVNCGYNALQLQHLASDTNMTVAENIINGAASRAFRFNVVYAGAQVNINNNVVLNAVDEAGEAIKASSNEGTFNLENNYWSPAANDAMFVGVPVPAATGLVDGTFTHDVSGYVANGYAATEDGGIWTVEEAEVEEEVFEKNIFVIDNFERGITEETAIASIEKGELAAASGVTIVNDPVYGNVMRVNREIGDTGEGDKLVIRYSIGSATKIVTDMDFNINQDVHYNYSAMTLCKDPSYGGSDANAPWDIFKKNNTLTASGDVVLTGTDFGGKWYSARVIYDLETGKTDWYVAERGKTLKYKGSHINESKPVPGRFLIASLGQGSEVYVDNLKIYEYEDGGLGLVLSEAEKDLRHATISPAVTSYDSAAKTALASAIEDAKAVMNNPGATATQRAAVVKAIKAAQKALILSEESIGGISYTRFNLDTHARNADILYGDGSTVNAEVNDTNDSDKAIRGDFATALNLTGNTNRVVLDSYHKDSGLEGFYLGADVTTIDFAFKLTHNTSVSQLIRVYAGGASTANHVFNVSCLYDSGEICIDARNENGENQRSVIIDSYNPNQWYQVKVAMNFKTQKLEVYVDGEKVLLDDELYFKGTGVLTWNYSRIESYGPAAGALYLADINVIDDGGRIVANALETARAGAPAEITAEAYSLPATAQGYTVTWSSDEFAVDGNSVSAGNAKDCGTLTAGITYRSVNYNTSLELPVAFSDYNVEELAINKVNGKYIAKAELRKTGIDRDELATLIIATYDASNKLVAVKFVDNSKWILDAGDVASIDADLDIPTGGKAKAFVCVLNILNPLCAEATAE